MFAYRKHGLIIGLALLALSSALASGGAASPNAVSQRIAIEEKATVTANGSGTFRLIPLTPGPLKADSGTFTFTGGQSGSPAIRKGQSVTTYKGVDVLQGKNGTLRIPNVTLTVDAGGGYGVGKETWSIAAGTGAYAHLIGGGAGANVGTPKGIVLTRYEGYAKR
jgi:hypothetical protein